MTNTKIKKIMKLILDLECDMITMKCNIDTLKDMVRRLGEDNGN